MSESVEGDSTQSQQQAVRSAQERTLGLYHQLMKINAASHLIRALRELRIIELLREQQCTAEQIWTRLALKPDVVIQILDAAVAIGIVEQYQEDYALSRASHLLCQYDHDLADREWNQLVGLAKGELDRGNLDDQMHANHLAATQWIHTPAAMEAAEVLDFGNHASDATVEILDLGCGSAVWTSAMAYRDASSKITAVDLPAALEAAQSTADSIGLGDRFQAVAADPCKAELEEAAYDWVVVAQRISAMGEQRGEQYLSRAAKFLKPNGRLVVIDLVEIGDKPTLADRVESLRLKLSTTQGETLTPEGLQGHLKAAGLVDCQFALLSKGNAKIGVAVASRPES